MSGRIKIALGVAVALLVALAAGFVWGATGRRAAEQALDDARQQLDLAEARGRILDARVSLYNVNFGDAQRQLADAKAPLNRARARYEADGADAAAQAMAAAIAHTEEAQRLASRLDPAANGEAGQALTSIQTATTSK